MKAPGHPLHRSLAIRVLHDVSRATGIPDAAILRAERWEVREMLAKHAAIWLLAELGCSYPSIARAFRCDQSTARYAHMTFAQRLIAGSLRHRELVARLLREATRGRRVAA